MSAFKPYPEVSLDMSADSSAMRIVDSKGEALIIDSNCDTAALERFVACWNACRKLYSPAGHITATDEYCERVERLRKEAWARVQELEVQADTFGARSSKKEHPEGWRPIETAPKDGTEMLLHTNDFGPVLGWWDANQVNFYKSQVGWAGYDPDNMQGDWVSHWHISPNDGDRRLYCGATPTHWQPVPIAPAVQEPA